MMLVRISLLVFIVVSILLSVSMVTHALRIDVKCAVYDSDSTKEGNVDVRILVLGLKNNTYYTSQVIPDHNPKLTVTTKTDFEGILWSVIQIPNGDHSLLFVANVYQGNGTTGKLVASGNDDAPCALLLNSPT